MTLTTTDILIAVVLVSCVPLQYFLVQNWGAPESSRSYTIKRLFGTHSETTSLLYVNLWETLPTHISLQNGPIEKKLIAFFTKFYEDYLRLDSWVQWILGRLNMPDITVPYGPEFDEGESPAVEVMKYKNDKGYFAMAPEPRTHRSPDVKYRVGQVVLHKNWKYRGVIIGWDESAKAPPEWIAELDAKNKKWKNMASYAVLVDTRDRLTPQLTYVPQDNIEVVKNVRIIHPLVENYFEQFDGAQYIPRPWLQTLYPQD